MAWLRHAGATCKRAAQSAGAAFSVLSRVTEPVSSFYAPAKSTPATRARTCNYGTTTPSSRSRSRCKENAPCAGKRERERERERDGREKKLGEMDGRKAGDYARMGEI